MFAGAKRRSSNVRVMQIFHELKAQFPTIPDHIITACIASHVSSSAAADSHGHIHELLLAAAAREQNQMGRPSIQLETPPFIPTPATTKQHPAIAEPTDTTTIPTPDGSRDDSQRIRLGDMNDSDSSDTYNRNERLVKISNNNENNEKPLVITSEAQSDINSNSVIAKRPNTLDINKSEQNDVRRLQLSEKCKDVHKLLNSPILVDKPPRSPLSAKRFAAKQVPKKDSPTSLTPPPKKETVSTPTQTTDTLVNNAPITSPSLNLSLNVNCQMGLVQSPPKPRCTTRVDLTPTQPWLNPNPFLNDPSAPRSFTSVNLTLRPPACTPQDPIDITSQNSSLTYSTSSFDKEKGLGSRLQITVGPGNGGNVSSVRVRPRSFHLGDSSTETVPVRGGSLNNLAAVSAEAPVLLKQQARIDRMQIELQTGNARLVIMRQEVEDLEKKRRQVAEGRTAAEIEKQLKMEIKHLTFQCGQLADMLDKDEFYNNIYTGPAGPLLAPQQQSPRPPPPRPPQMVRRQTRGRLLYQGPPFGFTEIEGPKWNCSVCTFLNHPDLDKCEQCDMPRVYHGTRRSTDSLTVDAIRRLPNPNNLEVPFDAFQRSANALRKCISVEPSPQCLPHLNTSSSTLSTNEMLRRLQMNDTNSSSVARNKANHRVPLSSSVSAPSVIHYAMNTNSGDA